MFYAHLAEKKIQYVESAASNATDATARTHVVLQVGERVFVGNQEGHAIVKLHTIFSLHKPKKIRSKINNLGFGHSTTQTLTLRFWNLKGEPWRSRCNFTSDVNGFCCGLNTRQRRGINNRYVCVHMTVLVVVAAHAPRVHIHTSADGVCPNQGELDWFTTLFWLHVQ